MPRLCSDLFFFVILSSSSLARTFDQLKKPFLRVECVDSAVVIVAVGHALMLGICGEMWRFLIDELSLAGFRTCRSSVRCLAGRRRLWISTGKKVVKETCAVSRRSVLSPFTKVEIITVRYCSFHIKLFGSIPPE